MFKKAVIFSFIIVFSLLNATEKVIRINAKNYSELTSILKNVFTKYDFPEITSGRPGEYYDLIVDDIQFKKLKSSGIKFDIIIEDLAKQKEIVKQSYHSYSQVVQILRNIASSYPSIAKVESIGPTYEGRWIYGLKISDNVSSDEEEPEQLFSGCHHAREWASVEVPLFIADSLTKAYGSDQTVTNIVNNREIWIFPVINVDGYIYDYNNGGVWWRKNRKPFHGYTGTDLNRNYNGICDSLAIDGWGMIPSGAAVYHNPSEDVFCGAIQFWGDAIKAYSDFIRQHNFVSIIDYHSYSELVLAPWGHKNVQTPHDSWYNSIGGGMAQRIQRLGGGSYTYEKSIQLYPTSGGSSDWQYGYYTYVNGSPSLCFVVELGTSFYQPTSDLPEIERENFEGAIYLLQKGDSIYNYMKTFVPAPVIVSPATDSVIPPFTLSWKPRNKYFNQPSYYEIQVLRFPNVVTEDFETQNGYWFTETFSRSTTRRHSGSYSLFSGNTDNIQAQARTKYPYYVEPGDSLKFWVYYDTENEWDVGIVEISEDKREWFPLISERWTGQSNGWVNYKIDLSQWVGKTVYFRWRYMTDGSVLNEGVYIDDIYPVVYWDTIRTISSNVTDTFYVFNSLPDGEYYFRVRGYSSNFGWGNWSALKKVYVKNVTGVEDKRPIQKENKSVKFMVIIPRIVKGNIITAKIFGINPVFSIQDKSGRTVFKKKIEIPDSYGIIQFTLKKPGTYFYQVEFINGEIRKGKILKIK